MDNYWKLKDVVHEMIYEDLLKNKKKLWSDFLNKSISSDIIINEINQFSSYKNFNILLDIIRSEKHNVEMFQMVVEEYFGLEKSKFFLEEFVKVNFHQLAYKSPSLILLLDRYPILHNLKDIKSENNLMDSCCLNIISIMNDKGKRKKNFFKTIVNESGEVRKYLIDNINNILVKYGSTVTKSSYHIRSFYSLAKKLPELSKKMNHIGIMESFLLNLLSLDPDKHYMLEISDSFFDFIDKLPLSLRVGANPAALLSLSNQNYFYELYYHSNTNSEDSD